MLAELLLVELVAAGVALAAAVVVLVAMELERLATLCESATAAVGLTWATLAAAVVLAAALVALAALITAQPPTVAASEAEVSRILTLLMAASRRLAVRVCFIV